MINAKSKRVILIGFMGSGKTTLGKKLAKHLGLPFYDTDLILAHKFGMSINNYFAQFGEESFRSQEQQLMHELNDLEGIVATGGGFPCHNDNINKLKAIGTVIYLQRPPKELFQRLNQAKNSRPKIKDLSSEALLAYITTLLEEREKFYCQADIIASRENQTIEKLIYLLGIVNDK